MFDINSDTWARSKTQSRSFLHLKWPGSVFWKIWKGKQIRRLVKAKLFRAHCAISVDARYTWMKNLGLAGLAHPSAASKGGMWNALSCIRPRIQAQTASATTGAQWEVFQASLIFKDKGVPKRGMPQVNSLCAMENGPFMDDLPSNSGHVHPFSTAILVYWKVIHVFWLIIYYPHLNKILYLI